MYYPYYGADNGFKRFLEFVIEKLDYDDEKLVECAYRIYEKYEANGDAYLKEKIFEDIHKLENARQLKQKNNASGFEDESVELEEEELVKEVDEQEEIKEEVIPQRPAKEPKKGLFSFLEGARRKDKDTKEKIRKENMYAMEFGRGVAVAEEEEIYGDDQPEEEYGRTVYIENVAEAKEETHRLFDSNGAVLAVLGEASVVIGKKRDEADIILDNSTISRVHARITFENGEYMLEDLNSTNGSFKNGLRLRPYERRQMIPGDEIRLGSVKILYK